MGIPSERHRVHRRDHHAEGHGRTAGVVEALASALAPFELASPCRALRDQIRFRNTLASSRQEANPSGSFRDVFAMRFFHFRKSVMLCAHADSTRPGWPAADSFRNESRCAAQVLRGGTSHFDSSTTKFEQPQLWEVFPSNHSSGNQIKALAADSLVRLRRKGLARSARKSERVTLHSTSTEWQARFQRWLGHLAANAGLSESTTPSGSFAASGRPSRLVGRESWVGLPALGVRLPVEHCIRKSGSRKSLEGYS